MLGWLLTGCLQPNHKSLSDTIDLLYGGNQFVDLYHKQKCLDLTHKTYLSGVSKPLPIRPLLSTNQGLGIGKPQGSGDLFGPFNFYIWPGELEDIKWILGSYKIAVLHYYFSKESLQWRARNSGASKTHILESTSCSPYEGACFYRLHDRFFSSNEEGRENSPLSTFH